MLSLLHKSINFQILVTATLLGICSFPLGLKLNALLGLLAAVALVWLLSNNKLSLKQSFCLGLIVTLIQFHWVAVVMNRYFQNSLFLCWVISFIIFIYSAFQFVIAAESIKFLKNKFHLESIFLLPLVWFLLEVFFPRLIPWYLASPLVYITPIATLARIGGPALTSAVLIIFIGLILRLIRQCNRKDLFLAVAVLTLTLSNYYYSSKKIEAEIGKAETISIAAVQANLDPSKDFTQAMLKKRTKKLQRFSKAILQKHPEADILVWPESAHGYTIFSYESGLRKGGRRDPMPGLNKPLIFGGQTLIRPKSNVNDPDYYYNTAYLLESDGNFSGQYRKRKLFPFSETAPLSSTFQFIDNLFTPASPYKPGTGSTVLKVNKAIIAMAICFEDIWPNIFKTAVKTESANLLLTISNDSWFAETAAGYQHQLLSLWRAVENSRYLLRVTNEGPSSLVSPLGELVTLTKKNKPEGFFIANIPLLKQ